MTISSKSRTSYFSNSPPTPHTPPKSPARARSHNDLLSLAREREEREADNQVAVNDLNSRSSLPATGTNGDVTSRNTDNLDPHPKRQDQLSFFLSKLLGGLVTRSMSCGILTQDGPFGSRLSPWAYPDDLFEKLLFSVVSDDGSKLTSVL